MTRGVFSPAYSTVERRAAAVGLPKFQKNVVRFVVEAEHAGDDDHAVNSTAGLKAYINTSDLDFEPADAGWRAGAFCSALRLTECEERAAKITLQEAPDRR